MVKQQHRWCEMQCSSKDVAWCHLGVHRRSNNMARQQCMHAGSIRCDTAEREAGMQWSCSGCEQADARGHLVPGLGREGSPHLLEVHLRPAHQSTHQVAAQVQHMQVHAATSKTIPTTFSQVHISAGWAWRDAAVCTVYLPTLEGGACCLSRAATSLTVGAGNAACCRGLCLVAKCPGQIAACHGKVCKVCKTCPEHSPCGQHGMHI